MDADEILEAFRPFAEYMADLKEEMDMIWRATGGLSRTMTVQEMADYWNVSVSSLRHQCRYLMPRFGIKKEGQQRYSCTREEFFEWARKGREQLRKDYERRALRA